MKRSLSFITFLILTAVVAAFAATPFCHIRHYDEYDGLSQRQVKQIATVTESCGLPHGTV